MRQYVSNSGKKETRQINQVLNKAVKENKSGETRDPETRTTARTHSLKRKSK